MHVIVSQFDDIPFDNATDTCGGFEFAYGVSSCIKFVEWRVLEETITIPFIVSRVVFQKTVIVG